MRRSGRAGQLSTADIAAELHALYTLAAIHVANQQDAQLSDGSSHHSKKQSLSDGDVLQLLKAYASLEDRSQQQSGAGNSTRHLQQDDAAWDSKTQAAAAAMGALYAFARLADPAGQQEQQHGDPALQDSQQDSQQSQQQSGQAPGQLQRAISREAPSSTVQAYKSLASSSQGQGSSSSSMRSSSHAEGNPSASASGDLQVLLKLAQLGLQAASQ
jgi:hypothetical protein